MKHTPGKWIAQHRTIQDGKGGSQRWHILAGADCSIQICSLPGWDEDDEANARLIAAAPELLDALKSLYEETADYIRINKLGDVHHNVSMQKARDAIAKATE